MRFAADPQGGVLPTHLVVILVMLALAVLVTLAFSVWRVMNELRRLNRSLAGVQKQVAPTLELIAREGEAAAARAARLQARSGQASGPRTGVDEATLRAGRQPDVG